MTTADIEIIRTYEAGRRLAVGEKLETTGRTTWGTALTPAELATVRKNRVVDLAIISGKLEHVQKHYDDDKSRWMINGVKPDGTETGWMTLDQIAEVLS